MVGWWGVAKATVLKDKTYRQQCISPYMYYIQTQVMRHADAWLDVIAPQNLIL